MMRQVFYTKWPLLEFYLTIWCLSLKTAIMRESIESMSYEYIRFMILWKNKEIYHFRLYTTVEIRNSQLRQKIENRTMREGFTVEELEEIIKMSKKYINEIKDKQQYEKHS
ncbi:MAG: hypothetical protein PHO75_02310 [Candidatus Shapirobacteria bacterium]|nr:hypothetical protein [Candidatus Shapirobacteria bacterium]